MQVLDLLKQRCSVRQYEDRRVERDKLLYVLEAARVAPSACNNQPWQFFVIDDPSLIARLPDSDALLPLRTHEAPRGPKPEQPELF